MKKESKKFIVRSRPRSGGVEPTGEKYFPPEEMKTNTNDENYSTGARIKTTQGANYYLES